MESIAGTQGRHHEIKRKTEKGRYDHHNIKNDYSDDQQYPDSSIHPYYTGVFYPPASHGGYSTVNYPPLKRTGSLSSGSDSAFSPVRTSSKSDEHQVSSTTEKSKRTRSPSPTERDRKHRSPSPGYYQEESADISSTFHKNIRPNFTKTETAAATSTTSSEEDDERLRMQKQAGRGRRGAIGAPDHRPPSCGTPLGKITEEANAGSKRLSKRRPSGDKTNNYDGERRERDDSFRAPLAPDDVIHKNNENFPQGPNVDPRLGNFYVQPHIPLDSKIRDGRYPFDPRRLSMPGDPVGGSPVLSEIPLIPVAPQSPLHPSINGAPGLFMGPGMGNPVNNASLDLYMRSLTHSPTMSILSQARGLSPRHSIQGRDGDKFPYQYYGTPQANATAAMAATSLANAGMTAASQNGAVSSAAMSQNGQGQSSLSTMAYYQLAQQQQSWLAAVAGAGGADRSLAMSFDRNGDMSRLSSPFYMRSRQGRKRALSISPSQSDSLSLDLMIRTSPNSLLPFTNSLGNSRNSSIGSAGSYGHLNARGIRY